MSVVLTLFYVGLGLTFLFLMSRDFRHAIIAGIFFTTFSLAALPEAVRELSGVPTSLGMFFVFWALLYGATRWKNQDAPPLFGPVKLMGGLTPLAILGLVVTLLTASAGFTEYGLSKSLLFIARSLAPILALAALAPFDEKDAKVIFGTILMGAVSVALQVFTVGDLTSERVVFSDDVNPITLGRIMGVGVTLLLVRAFMSIDMRLNTVLSLGAVVVSIPIGFGMLMTGSRGPLLAVGGAVLSVLLLHSFRVGASGFGIVRILAIGSAIVLAVSYAPIEMERYAGYQRIATYMIMIGENSSDSGRVEYLDVATESIRDSYGIGLGTGGFGKLFGRTDRVYPHNIFIEVLVEQGFTGLFIMLFSAYQSVYGVITLIRSPNYGHYTRILSCLWIFALVNACVSGDLSTNNTYWISGALAWMLCLKPLQIGAFEPEVVATG